MRLGLLPVNGASAGQKKPFSDKRTYQDLASIISTPSRTDPVLDYANGMKVVRAVVAEKTRKHMQCRRCSRLYRHLSTPHLTWSTVVCFPA